MNIRNYASKGNLDFECCGYSSTDHGRQSTTGKIDLQTLFHLVSDDNADNQII